MSHSVSSSLSSEDQFDVLRTNNTGDVEVSLATTTTRQPPASTSAGTAKTPAILKTPSMDALTRKYEFLLDGNGNHKAAAAEDDDQDNDSYFKTPPVSARLERLQSYVSQDSRQSSRSATPTTASIVKKPALSAQSILERLQSDEKGPPRVPSASQSWDIPPQHDIRQRSPHLKQNLEHRLRLMEDNQITGGGSEPRPPQHHQTPPRRTPQQQQRRNHKQHPSPPRRRSFGFVPTPKDKRQTPKLQQQQTQQTTDVVDPSFSPQPVRSSATTATTAALSEDVSSGIHAMPPEPSLEHHYQEQFYLGVQEEEKKGASFDQDDTASFWHRWKMAEKRMQQQQEQFEHEKVEWVRQLESAYDANNQVNALAKRMEVQLLAVHKTVLHEDGETVNEEEGEIVPPAKQELPIDPLHLLMLKENGKVPEDTTVEDLNAPSSSSSDILENENSITGVDSFEYTEKLERRMARTKTKNVILSHLVRLLERQGEEQRQEWEERLKLEKDERKDLAKELEHLERRMQEQTLMESHATAKRIADGKLLSSPLPTETDPAKALQNRLWLREQQYEQERRDFDAKITTLRSENDRYKQQLEEQLTKPIPRKKLKTPQNYLEKQMVTLQTQLEFTNSEKETLQSQRDGLQSKYDAAQEKLHTTERDQRRKEVKHMQLVNHLENQLSKAQGDATEKGKEVSRLKSVLEESCAELASLKKFAREQKSMKQADDEQGFQLEEEITKLEFSLQVERENAKDANNEKQRLEKEMRQLQRDHANQLRESDKRMMEAEKTGLQLSMRPVDQALMAETYEDMDVQLQEVTKQLENSTEALEAEASKCAKLEEMNYSLQNEIDLMNNQHSEQAKAWESTVQELKADKGSFADARTVVEGVSKQRDEMETQWRQTNSELDAALEALELADVKRSELEEKNLNLSTQLQQLNERFISEMKQLEARIVESKIHQSELTDRNASVEALLNESEQDHAHLRAKKAGLEELAEQLNNKLEAEKLRSRALDQQHKKTCVELQQLNKRFVGEMKEMSKRYQSLLSENNLMKEKNEYLEDEIQELNQQSDKLNSIIQNASNVSGQNPNNMKNVEGQTIVNSSSWKSEPSSPSVVERELREENSLLVAKVEILENNLKATSNDLKRVTDESSIREQELAKLSELYTKEKLEWESQMQHLSTCESSDSVRTQELIEQKEERERQLEEAKRELEAGLRKLSEQSDEYRAAVVRNAALDGENKQIRLEKKDWELKLQAALDEAKRVQEVSASNANLKEQILGLQKRYDGELQGWNEAKEQHQAETCKMQQHCEELLSEKHSLQNDMSAAKREIETMRNLHMDEKREWNERYKTTNEQAETVFKRGVQELKEEVITMAQQIAFSNQTIKELTNSRSLEKGLLTGFDRLQQELAASSRRIMENLGSVDEDRSEVVQRIDDMKRVLSQQQEALLERIKDVSSQWASEHSSLQYKSDNDLRQYEADLLLAKEEIQNLSNDIAIQETKRKAAEKESATLRERLHLAATDSLVPRTKQDDHAELQLCDAKESIEFEIETLDNQLSELSAKIDSELDEIRHCCSSDCHSIVEDGPGVEDSDELAGARQAMLAQTVLLVQNLQRLVVADAEEDEEDKSAHVMQHLEVLSELMGQVDSLEADNAQSASLPLDLNRSGELAETDLLELELGQDDSIDLLHDSPSKRSVTFKEDTVVPSDRGVDDQSRTSSPVELVVDAVYRCQQLESERSQLIHTTLDLLQSSREANQAELDAALASARRKASEEMIAMKQQTQFQVEQLWQRLCDKCRHELCQG